MIFSILFQVSCDLVSRKRKIRKGSRGGFSEAEFEPFVDDVASIERITPLLNKGRALVINKRSGRSPVERLGTFDDIFTDVLIDFVSYSLIISGA